MNIIFFVENHKLNNFVNNSFSCKFYIYQIKYRKVGKKLCWYIGDNLSTFSDVQLYYKQKTEWAFL